jgi:hypothetical protein
LWWWSGGTALCVLLLALVGGKLALKPRGPFLPVVALAAFVLIGAERYDVLALERLGRGTVVVRL